MKIVTILGARPQFIKAATVSRVIGDMDDICEILVHTGQHFDHNMSEVFFQELEIPRPDYNLGIGNCSHGAMTGRQLEAIEDVLINEKPDWVLVYGDTNSTLSGALAAVKLNIPVAHVEAGLRSFNRRMPEEINRIMVDHVASLLCAPTQNAVNNLKNEGISGRQVVLSGDVMYDAAVFYGEKAEIRKSLLAKLGVSPGQYALLTLHRAGNTEDRDSMSHIINGMIELSQRTPVIFPLHPRTRKVLNEFRLLEPLVNSLKVIDPIGYLDMVLLEKYASIIITDSGGVQKEAYFHRKPCITLREETEWNELVENGWNKLIDPAKDNILQEILKGHDSEKWKPLYGEGNAAPLIMNCILEF